MDMRCIRRLVGTVPGNLGNPCSDRSGAASIEYSLLAAAVVAVGCVTLYSGTLGQGISGQFKDLTAGFCGILGQAPHAELDLWGVGELDFSATIPVIPKIPGC